MKKKKKNLFASNKNTITIDNIIQQLITEPGCQKTVLVNYADHLEFLQAVNSNNVFICSTALVWPQF